MAVFPLLKLPQVAQKYVIYQLEIEQIIHTTLINRKFAAAVRACKLGAILFDLILHNPPCDYMRIRLQFSDDHQICFHLKHLPVFSSVFIKTQQGFIVPCDSSYDVQEKILERLTSHFHDIIRFEKYGFMAVQVPMSNIMSCFIWKYSKKFLNFTYSQNKVDRCVTQANLRFLLEHLIVEQMVLTLQTDYEEFQPRFKPMLEQAELRIRFDSSISFESFLDMKCKKARVEMSSASSQDIVCFVESWMKGKLKNLEEFIVEIHRNVFYSEELLGALDKMIVPIDNTNDMPSHIRTTKRQDGRLGKITLDLQDTSCTSTDQPPTFLFAYSNDFSQQTIQDAWEEFVDIEDEVSLQYSTFGNVRFDTRIADSIQWHTNYQDVKSSINAHLPNSALGFGSTSTGSDVIKTIEKYFDNGSVQVCGSIVLVLLKRYPNEVDISSIVARIRSHHAIVHAIISSSPSGGSQPQTVYNIASKANGLGAFEDDYWISQILPRFPLFATPFPIYSTNVHISGKGTIILEPLTIPTQEQYYVSLTFQDHLPLDSIEKVDLSWYTNKISAEHFIVTYDSAINYDGGGTFSAGWWEFQGVTYSMKLEYEFSGSNVESLQIRVSSDIPLDSWLPYSD